LEKFALEARQLFGLHLSAPQLAAFQYYEGELLEWNQRINLTAISEPEEIRRKHFLDSFSCLLAWRETPPGRLIDVGSGAGFPGLPLKLIYPAMRLTLVESVGKKASFLRHMVDALHLEGVEVLWTRAEETGQAAAHREKYDWAVARAVAELPILAEYLLPLVRIGGSMLAQKGPAGPAEANKSGHAFKILGGKLRQLIPIELPGVAEERFLVVVDKAGATPPAYPRRPGVASKKPL